MLGLARMTERDRPCRERDDNSLSKEIAELTQRREQQATERNQLVEALDQ